jgi:hypothetical protein
MSSSGAGQVDVAVIENRKIFFARASHVTAARLSGSGSNSPEIHTIKGKSLNFMVGGTGIEPVTPAV